MINILKLRKKLFKFIKDLDLPDENYLIETIIEIVKEVEEQ